MVNPSPKVFLSYAASDLAEAEVIADKLHQAGVAPVLDRMLISPGEPILLSLRRELGASDFLVLLLSPSLLGSSKSQDDLEYAISTDLPQRAVSFLPVKIKPVNVPHSIASWTLIDATRDLNKAAESIARLVRDAPLVQLEKLGPQELERLVADLLRAYGFKNIKQSVGSRDQGFDFSADVVQRDPFGRPETSTWFIEVKGARGQADVPSLQPFLRALGTHKQRGLFITSAELTSPAKRWLEEMQKTGGPRISILEGAELRRLTLQKPRLVQKYFAQRSK